jgi:arylsulfatase A-like enzyme
MRWKLLPAIVAALAVMLSSLAVGAQQQPPNILVIMGDDIGYWNISAYNRGQMGYRTSNIDRIANEGAILTDYYGLPAALRSSPGRARCAPGC